MQATIRELRRRYPSGVLKGGTPTTSEHVVLTRVDGVWRHTRMGLTFEY